MISWLALLLLLPLVSALPLQRRANKSCGKFDSIPAGPYSLLTNLWGEGSATSGQQCSTLQSVNGNTVSWWTEWEWTGDDSVKSFSNMQLNEGINQQLSAIKSMPSIWHWAQMSSDTSAVFDVSYDLFTGYSPGGAQANEMMVWLAKYGSQPVSYAYDADGQSVPIETEITLAGHVWNLHQGYNGYNNVFSFCHSGDPIMAFEGDVFEFITHLIDRGLINASEYLVTAQAGTEATSGSDLFDTSAYSLEIN